MSLNRIRRDAYAPVRVGSAIETDVDCGGGCPNACNPGQGCQSMWDCASQIPFGGTFAYCVSGVCTSY